MNQQYTEKEANDVDLNLPLVGDTFGIIEAAVQNIFTIKHKNTKLFDGIIVTQNFQIEYYHVYSVIDIVR